MLRIPFGHATHRDVGMKIPMDIVSGIVVICVLLLNQTTIGYAAADRNDDGKFSDINLIFAIFFL